MFSFYSIIKFVLTIVFTEYFIFCHIIFLYFINIYLIYFFYIFEKQSFIFYSGYLLIFLSILSMIVLLSSLHTSFFKLLYDILVILISNSSFSNLEIPTSSIIIRGLGHKIYKCRQPNPSSYFLFSFFPTNSSLIWQYYMVTIWCPFRSSFLLLTLRSIH